MILPDAGIYLLKKKYLSPKSKTYQNEKFYHSIDVTRFYNSFFCSAGYRRYKKYRRPILVGLKGFGNGLVASYL